MIQFAWVWTIDIGNLMKTKPFILCFALMAFGRPIVAQDAFYHAPLNSLKFSQGSLPTAYKPGRSNWQLLASFQPYAVLDGEGEAYIGGENLQPWSPPVELLRTATLVVRAPAGKPVTGRLCVPNDDFTGLVALPFKLDASASTIQSRQEFFKAKEGYYRRLRDREIPGGAWFRHQETEAAKAHDAKAAAPSPNPWRNNRRPAAELDGDYDSTYDLFSGGRALSENLQLDRVLPAAASGAATVDITNVPGISVREMDWKPLLNEAKPKADPLAAFIPADQHALFFPNFEALSLWLDQADSDGTPVLQMFEPRSEDANSRGRYQKQLCWNSRTFPGCSGPR